MGPLVGPGGMKAPGESSENDLAADIDKELGFGSYRIPDFPFGSSSSGSISSRKRGYPSESPIPMSPESSFGDLPTPKRTLFTPEKLPPFQRAEMLLSASVKKEAVHSKESGEVIELRKEVAKQKTTLAEQQATVCFSCSFFFTGLTKAYHHHPTLSLL